MVLSRLAVCLAGLAIVSAWVPQAGADIYRYQDEDGVWHFTNIKTDTRYKLYIRTSKRKSAAYIKKYDGIIRQASRRFGVDPHLIKAVIKAESDFDHRAVSHKGARGLMQLMPTTARKMEVENPFDPEENIFGGTRYLSQLLERFKPSLASAIAAYNVGPEKVEQFGGVPPIPETRAFVEKVLGYYRQYQPPTR
ncbi:MAG: transglycosylase SLT domain-containing protein [Deltaproteobacteria bacterium]|nr:transglycosylase SLT domain-containing protein [Deltaproteobacteria bacterium]MBW1950802.1 transglycosylase SLT domain-containing protein [Deltaproteobacteria bacterium]MBW2008984.1 transglycosylase SLT domain-containing protein [Deltaproteobacteria bacterium]RLB36913.1 MAG: lytic transglycosylase [Deltaproteobacteria bacterium]